MNNCIKRVGAILSAKEKTVRFFGYGCYIGDFVPMEAVGFLADVMKEAGYDNPKILLDNGQVVYGCECWWGDKDSVKARIEAYVSDGYTIVDITPDEVRKEFLERMNNNKVFTTTIDSVVATSIDDAMAVWRETVGDNYIDGYGDRGDWHEVQGEELLAIHFDEIGSQIKKKGLPEKAVIDGSKITATSTVWAAWNGRGFLCSNKEGIDGVRTNTPSICDRCKDKEKEAFPLGIEDDWGNMWQHLCNDCSEELGLFGEDPEWANNPCNCQPNEPLGRSARAGGGGATGQS